MKYDELDRMEVVLEASRTNARHAARTFRVSHTSVLQWMREYGVPRNRVGSPESGARMRVKGGVA